jgi:hypothetical protein
MWHTDRMVAHYDYDPYGYVVGPDTDPPYNVFDSSDDSGRDAATYAFRFSAKSFDDETGIGYWG